jgi:GDP-L-fucose synthase
LTKNINHKIFVAGHNGMLGSAICIKLKAKGFKNILLATRQQLDLANQKKVFEFFKKHKIDQVYLCAAKVGGIMSNKTFPADYIYSNLQITLNVVNAAKHFSVNRLLFVGSSCIYPRNAPQPMKEEYLLTSAMEKSNEPYAISKIAGIKICESYNRQFNTDFRSVMPTNLYGDRDTYDDFNSHVIPALILKFHNAKVNQNKKIILWGTGKAKREFLHADDMANFCIKILNLPKEKILNNTKPQQSHINLGTGEGITIKNLSNIIAKIVGYKGKIIFDSNYPDGHPKKINNISLQKKFNCSPSIDLISGIRRSYKDYLKRHKDKNELF